MQNKKGLTLDSGIDIGPTFINLGLFSRPYGYLFALTNFPGPKFILCPMFIPGI